METRKIGRSGLMASQLGFGCMGLTGAYGQVDALAASRTLEIAVESGINFFDTADVYGAGGNERLIGTALSSHRNRLIIATKGGATRDAQGRPTNCGRPEYLKQACEESLLRLGLEQIDLYYLHRVDPLTPIEESVGALSQLVEQGKIRAIGLSEVSAETLRRAHRVHPIAALQSEYSLTYRQPETAVFDTCNELGVSFVAYSPLGRGLLTGDYIVKDAMTTGDMRIDIPRFSAESMQHNYPIVKKMVDLSERLGVTAPQLALAWILNRRPAVFAIPGTRNGHRVKINAQAAALSLSQEVFNELSELFTDDAIKGERHTAHMLARVGL